MEIFRSALSSLRTNKLRSALTTLGIVIGVAGVIAVVSVVQGLQSFIDNEFARLGAGTVMVMPGGPDQNKGPTTKRIKLTYQDGQALLREVPLVTTLAPILWSGETLKAGTKKTSTTLIGTTAAYQEIVTHYVDRGRFFSFIDGSHRRRVCVPGTKVLDDLNIKGDPLGKTIRIQGEDFLIIGVMEEQGMMFGQSQDDFIFIPFETAAAVYGPARADMIQLRLRVKETSRMEEATDRIREVIRRRHSLGSDDGDDFQVMTQKQIMEISSRIFGIATAVASGVAGIALLVGGIGIMNIMLVSVTERTREIGIRKAVGARRPTILRQFLVEAIILCLAGGGVGIGLGYGAGALAAKLIPHFPPAHVPLWTVAIAVLFSSVVGVVFGVYPAYKAAAMDPIAALRHE